MFMVLLDAYSKWLEVVPMTTTTTEKTLEVLWSMFARYGLPNQIVSDNGPQFTSTEFEEFMRITSVLLHTTQRQMGKQNDLSRRSKHSLRASKDNR